MAPQRKGFVNAPIQEMIEAYLTIDKEAGGPPASADDIAADMADNLCAQGFISADNEVEINQAIHLITTQIQYMRGEKK